MDSYKVSIQLFQTYEKTHPRSSSIFLKRGGEEDFLLPFSFQKRRGWGMSCEPSEAIWKVSGYSLWPFKENVNK